eukprot:CAMPEP_0176408496 /NCGR_PEP_ID=MMETSP0127-20121128/1984_1 /TAXON_ID=938130 /ORGANISM="Platyophrya macrostoma, Strain WH" /LENGTH=339 /DNA_ID=CAMNT_0017787789 /DNA_START=61 /DNA_END=1080 /DNA_ORIENTATION=-
MLNTVAALVTILGFLSTSGVLTYLLLAKASVWMSILSLCSPFLYITVLLYQYTSLKTVMDFLGDRIFLRFFYFFFYKRVYIWDFNYTVLCWLIPDAGWKHMNWGYAALTENGHTVQLKPEDENERFSTQYSHFVGTVLGSLTSLEGKTLVEISSGRGGALSYYSRYLNPKKCIGIDLSEAQVDFCNKTYAHDPKLVFYHGDAENLSKVKQLKGENIDMVINIDSGHCYPNFKRFVQEVAKILAPGGLFLYSDFRPVEHWEETERELATCFEIVRKENISKNAIHALKLDEARKRKMMQEKMGPILSFYFSKVGGVKGSMGYEGLNSGRTTTMSFVLQKK